jgi:hypothetical protein
MRGDCWGWEQEVLHISLNHPFTLAFEICLRDGDVYCDGRRVIKGEHELNLFDGSRFYILTGFAVVRLLGNATLTNEIGAGVMLKIWSLKLIDAPRGTKSSHIVRVEGMSMKR